MLEIFHLLVWFSDVGQSTGSPQRRCCSGAFTLLLYDHPDRQMLALGGVWSRAFWLQDDLIIHYGWQQSQLMATENFCVLALHLNLKQNYFNSCLFFLFFYYYSDIVNWMSSLHRFRCSSSGCCSSCLALLTHEKQLQQQWEAKEAQRGRGREGAFQAACTHCCCLTITSLLHTLRPLFIHDLTLVLVPPPSPAGDVSPISMSPISQSQFIPLGEILCLAISAMNAAHKPANQEALMEHLTASFPGTHSHLLL